MSAIEIFWAGEMRRLGRIVVAPRDIEGTIEMTTAATMLDVPVMEGWVEPEDHDLWVGFAPNALRVVMPNVMLARLNEVSLVTRRLGQAWERAVTAAYDVEEDDPDPLETVSPCMVDLSDDLTGCFGKTEDEMLAVLLVRFAQARGGWVDFRRFELRKFAKDDDLLLDWAEVLGWLENRDDGTFSFTGKFVDLLPLHKSA